jgi:AmmeMemoRadiSam system protein A
MKLWVLGTAIVVAGALILVGTREAPVEKVGPLEFTSQEKQILLDLARETLRTELSGEAAPEVDASALPEALRAEAACFVTLKKEERLRGCILDAFLPHEPVYANVMRNVLLAATHDPRFPPVSPEEVDGLSIEISILGRSYAIGFESPEELISSLRPGVDGVILTTTYGSSTYLPQVWEQLPDPEVFLSELCRKHGAPGECWKTKDLLRVEVYQANHFGEADEDSQAPGED